jgi:hypothetical protein
MQQAASSSPRSGWNVGPGFLALAVLWATSLLCTGCHLIYPFEVTVAGATTDGATTDGAPFEGSPGEAGPDSVATLTGICPFVADQHTAGLFTFEPISSNTFVNKVAGGPTGSLVNLPGFALKHVVGPPRCGGVGLATPIPAHAASCTQCGSTVTFSCTHAGHAVIPSWSGTKLKQGSIDIWVRFAATGQKLQGIVSRDAAGQVQPGHISVFLHGDGFIAVRLQKLTGPAKDPLVCSKLVVKDTWYHVGVNFGPTGLELYVNGERVAVIRNLTSDTCGDGKERDVGLDGNDEPWIVGGLAWQTCVGTSAPVIRPLKGTVANFRISAVRRDFAKLYK